MIQFLYTLLIFPVELIIELSYLFINRIFLNPALSVLGVSFVVSILTLPLYFVAEKIQQKERNIQAAMKPHVDVIKKAFSGDERFMRLATYYRQNAYHPLYSLKSSISLLIQIPFFIAAFHFLSNLEMVRGISLGPIQNLGKPDSLITIKNVSLNFLPILMTCINFISALVYTKGLGSRDKIQLYGMAAVFLILLYNSPAVMVLYWTGNNVFSLIKNILQKTKNPKKIILISLFVLCIPMIFYIVCIHSGWIVKRLTVAFFIALVPFVMLFVIKFKKIKMHNADSSNAGLYFRIFALSVIILFLLGGLVIPSSLIASSVQEFSFIGNYSSPFPFIAHILLQCLGIFILWPLCIYAMFPMNVKKIFALLAPIAAITAVVNVFIFSDYYGYLTILFRFSQSVGSSHIKILLNIAAIIAGIFLIIILKRRFKFILQSMLIICICGFMFLGVYNVINIHRQFASFLSQMDHEVTDQNVYRFSRNGQNLVLIMLDRAISGYIPYIFEEKPELYSAFNGFVWYNNTISFGATTNFALPGLYGGYEFTPLEMQKRDTVPLVEKHNQALLMLPKIFLENDFSVTVTDPGYANYSFIPDLSIYNDYPLVNARNIIGRYTGQWLLHKPDLLLTSVTDVIETTLIRFSFFRFSPMPLRNFIYDRGRWLKTKELYGIQLSTINNYIALDILPDITEVSDSTFNTYNAINNDLPHSPWFLEIPGYTLSNEITNRGDGPFSNEDHYHVNVAALLLLGKWFDFLKENGVYDNSRIIIVSDHGTDIRSNFENNILLPDGASLQTYAALLMVKDFDSDGFLKIDPSFMTNADVPFIAVDGIIANPVNPWTGNVVQTDKDNGVTITSSGIWNVNYHPRYIFDIKQNQWLHVHTSIFDPDNWSQVSR